MLVRIPWTEASASRDAAVGDIEGEGGAVEVKREREDSGTGAERSLEDNTCDKVWEGPVRERAFQGFRAKACPTDGSAREVLGEKMAAYWDVAKAFVREEDL